MLATKHCTLPNITIPHVPMDRIQGVQVALGDLIESKSLFREMKKKTTFNKYFGFNEETQTYLTPYDLFNATQVNKNRFEYERLRVKGDSGFSNIKVEEYMEIINLIEPNYAVGLANYPSIAGDNR